MTVIITALTLTAIIIVSYITKKTEIMLASIFIFFTMELDIKIGLQIGSHYILLAMLMFLCFLEYKKRKLIIKRPLKVFIISWIAIICFYAIGYFMNGNIEDIFAAAIKFVGLSVYVLEITLFVLLLSLYSPEKVKKSIIIWSVFILSINILFTFMQLWFPVIGEKMLRLLVDSGSLNHVMNRYGYFTRGFGIYSSPVLLGAVSLMFIGLITPTLLKSRINNAAFYYILLFTIFTIGLFSYTKTIILGYPIFAIAFVILVLTNKEISGLDKLKKIALLFIIMIIAFAAWYFIEPSENMHVRDAYLSYLGDDFWNIFSTRQKVLFDEVPSGTITKSAFSVIKEHPIIGVGPLSTQGEYLHDLQYISLLHNGGILAFLAIGSMYIYLFILAVKNKRYESILIIIMLGAIGFGMEPLTNTILIPFVAMILCQLCNSWQVEHNKLRKRSDDTI